MYPVAKNFLVSYLSLHSISKAMSRIFSWVASQSVMQALDSQSVAQLVIKLGIWSVSSQLAAPTLWLPALLDGRSQSLSVTQQD